MREQRRELADQRRQRTAARRPQPGAACCARENSEPTA